MNYINISTDNLQELKSLRDLVVNELDNRNEEDTLYQKLQEDLWDYHLPNKKYSFISKNIQK